MSENEIEKQEEVEEVKQEKKSKKQAEVVEQTIEKDEPKEIIKESQKQEIKDPVGLPQGKKMSFRQCLAIHRKLWPVVDLKRGTVGHNQLMRIWNTFAILFPEKCADTIIWVDPNDPKLMNNDLNIPDLLKSLEGTEQ